MKAAEDCLAACSAGAVAAGLDSGAAGGGLAASGLVAGAGAAGGGAVFAVSVVAAGLAAGVRPIGSSMPAIRTGVGDEASVSHVASPASAAR